MADAADGVVAVAPGEDGTSDVDQGLTSGAAGASDDDIVIDGGADAPADGSADDEETLARPHNPAMLPYEELLGRSNFSAIDYVNRVFPDQDSLDELPAISRRVRVRVQQLDASILRVVRDQAHVGDKSQRDLDTAKAAIRELFAKIGEIKRKAEESEAMVDEITKDIKSLDYGKRNLSRTITALKRLQMLVAGVDRLAAAVKERNYEDAAAVLESTIVLSENFERYRGVPQIADLHAGVEVNRSALAQMISVDFQDMHKELSPDAAGQLRAACTIMNSLGQGEDFSASFVEAQANEYRMLFSAQSINYGLDKVEERFLWLREKLRFFDNEYASVFPAEWKIAERVALRFCEATRDHFDRILVDTQESLNVAVFLGVMQLTLDLEKYLAKRFLTERVIAQNEDGDVDDVEDEEPPPDLSAKERIAWRYRRYKVRREAGRGGGGGGGGDGGDGPTVVREENRAFKGVISSIFESYMHLYLAVEDTNLGEMIASFSESETWDPADDREISKVLPSSTDIVIYFKKSLTRCNSIANGQSFYDLHKLFRRHLINYADLLKSKLPKAAALEKENQMSVSMDLSEAQVGRVLRIVNTAVYLQEATEQLEGSMRRKINSVFADNVDFEDAANAFTGLVGKSTLVLVLCAMTRVQPALTLMTKLPWGDWERVGDHSEYIDAMRGALGDMIPIVRRSIKAVYFNRFCEKFVSSLVQAYVAAILKIKVINAVGAEQLIVNAEALSDLLLELPYLNDDDEEAVSVPRRYKTFVSNQLRREENILKVLLAEDEALVELYLSIVPGAHRAECVRLMEMTGMRKSEINSTLDSFDPDRFPLEWDERPAPSSSTAAAAAVTASLASTKQTVAAASTRMKNLMSKRFRKGGGGGGGGGGGDNEAGGSGT